MTRGREILVIALSIVTLSAGCVGATLDSLDEFAHEGAVTFFLPRAFNATYAVQHPTEPGEVTLTLGSARRVLDAEGTSREALTLTFAYRLRDPMDTSRIVSSQAIESIDAAELRIIGQEESCRPLFPSGRACEGFAGLYFGLEGFPAVVGLGAINGEVLEEGPLNVHWWSRWGSEHAQYAVERMSAEGRCFVVTLLDSTIRSYYPGYHLKFSGLADRLTFCAGAALPVEIAVDGAVLTLTQLVVQDPAPIARKPPADPSRVSSNPSYSVVKRPVIGGFPPEGHPTSEFALAEAFDWAREHDDGLRAYLTTNRDVALMSTSTSIDGYAGTGGLDETTWYIRKIALQDLASGRQYSFTVEKKVTRFFDDLISPLVEYRVTEASALEGVPTVAPSVLDGEMVTMASARRFIEDRFSPQISLSGLRSQLPVGEGGAVNLENRFLHFFWFSRDEPAPLRVLEGVQIDAASGRLEALLVRGDEWLPAT